MLTESTRRLLDWRPDAVVFDCDGLLVDTEPCWSVAEAELFARRGLGFGPAEKELVIGRSVQAVGEVLARHFGETDAASGIADELLRLVQEVVGRRAEAMPGALELVMAVSRRVPIAVASNSPRGLLDTALSRGGLADLVPVTVAADEVPAAKPAPDLYLAACAALAAPPSRCLAFEDSMTGLRSARAAELRIVGVPTLRHAEFPSDVVFLSLRDQRLLEWVDTW